MSPARLSAEERFPTQGGPSLPWSMVLPHEAQMLRNHCGQTFEHVKQRSGLGCAEMIAVLDDVPWHERSDMTEREARDELERRRVAYEDDGRIRAAEAAAYARGIEDARDAERDRLAEENANVAVWLGLEEWIEDRVSDHAAEIRERLADRDRLHAAWVRLLDGPDETPEGIDGEIRENLDFWVDEYRHAYEKLCHIDELQDDLDRLAERCARLEAAGRPILARLTKDGKCRGCPARWGADHADGCEVGALASALGDPS